MSWRNWLFLVTTTGLRSGRNAPKPLDNTAILFPVTSTGLRCGAAIFGLPVTVEAALPGHDDRAP